MKKIQLFPIVIICILLLTQCKKTVSPLPTDDVDTPSDSAFADGRYIIRTKYCADGKGYALIAPNLETLSFDPMYKDDLGWMKTDEKYIWHVEGVRIKAVGYGPPGTVPTYFGGYRMYKINPNGGAYHLLAMHRVGSSDADEVGDGWGANQYLSVVGILPKPENPASPFTGYPKATDHPGHYDEVGTIFHFSHMDDGGYKMRHSETEYDCADFDNRHWWISTTNDRADGRNCDWIQRPTIRPGHSGIAIGPNASPGLLLKCGQVNEDQKRFERCYSDVFYFEKVD